MNHLPIRFRGSKRHVRAGIRSLFLVEPPLDSALEIIVKPHEVPAQYDGYHVLHATRLPNAHHIGKIAGNVIERLGKHRHCDVRRPSQRVEVDVTICHVHARESVHAHVLDGTRKQILLLNRVMPLLAQATHKRRVGVGKGQLVAALLIEKGAEHTASGLARAHDHHAFRLHGSRLLRVVGDRDAIHVTL